MTHDPLQPAPQPSSDETPPTEANDSDQLQQRLAKVQQYRAHALSRDDALAAVIGSSNSGLIELGLHLERALVRKLSTDPDVVDAAKRLEPAMNMLLRLHRQSDRYAHLEHRIEAKQAARQPLPISRN